MSYTLHDNLHRKITNELILKHCNKNVLEAKSNNQNSWSNYEYDRISAIEENDKKDKLRKLQQPFKFRK